MPSTYTTNLGIEKIATGEQSGTWGNTTNTNLDILDQSIDGIISITLASAGSSGSPNSLPITDGAVSNGRNKFIEFVDGGDLGATAYVQLTPNDSEKIVHIRNSLSASRSIIVFQGTYNASNDYEILNGEDVLLKFDGAGAGAVVSQVFANLALPSVNIDGGTIDGAVIGGASAAAGSFTTLSASSPISAADGSASAPSVTNTGDTNTGIFFPAADTVGVAVGGTEVWRYGSNPTTAKNIFINGSCAVAQRGSQSSVASGYGACDRWEMNALGGASARYTLSQESSGGVGGNAKWAKVLVTTADASPGTNEAHYFGQKIEGFNAQSLLDDSGDLLASTMSFDVIVHTDGASSISFPATLAICVNDNGFGNQQYVKTFTVTAADTWQRVSVPIAANTSIVINNDNTNQFQVSFTIYSGTARETTDATWESAAGLDVSVSGVANLADATNNYLGITNVQLEVGSVATDFEYEDYGTTLRKCLRYFNSLTDGATNDQSLPTVASTADTGGSAFYPFPVAMRASPTLSYSDLSHFGCQPAMVQQNPSDISTAYVMKTHMWIQLGWSSSGSSLAAVRFYTLSSSANLYLSAEL